MPTLLFLLGFLLLATVVPAQDSEPDTTRVVRPSFSMTPT